MAGGSSEEMPNKHVIQEIELKYAIELDQKTATNQKRKTFSFSGKHKHFIGFFFFLDLLEKHQFNFIAMLEPHWKWALELW